MLSRPSLSRSLASSTKAAALQNSSRPPIQLDFQRWSEAAYSKRVPLQQVTSCLPKSGQVRWNSSSSIDKYSSPSIFNTPDSPWDRLHSQQKPPQPSESVPRRVEMTTQEKIAVTNFFDEIFQVANAVEADKPSEDRNEEDGEEKPLNAGAFSKDFYDRIRRTPGKPKWYGNLGEELDKKKEEMDLCRTDQELLDWTLVEVFAASQKYEAEAREMTPQMRIKRNITLQPIWYPYVIARLMQIFRDKYQNPHTSLAIFNHTKTVSIASYAFGCSTDAYNELVQTYWSCFRDANAVLDSLREMQVNGVTMNLKTGRFMDIIRRDVGEEKLWSEDEVFNIITRLDGIRRDAESLEVGSTRFKGRERWDRWKNQTLQDDPSDKWGFNNWGRE